ncbi:alpha-ketoglutarate-dependent dioxygenase AlkB [Sphingomonas sp. CJ20]
MSGALLDLFPAASIPGLSQVADMLDSAAESALIAHIDAAPLMPFRFQGWVGKRLTASFGWRYDFDDQSFTPGPPLPDWLLPLRERVAQSAGLPADGFVHALLTRYDPGAGIGWHRDRPVFDHIAGVSLGNPASLRFRRRRERGFDRVAIPLPPRSLYHMTGEARHQWEHSIAPVAAPRWSITFRSLRNAASR